MKNDRLLQAFGQIDERFIAEASIETSDNNTRRNTMKTKKTSTFYKRPFAIAAVLALCLCLSGVTALAASGSLSGFFRDIVAWNGTVVGSAYDQATDELALSAGKNGGQLAVEIAMLLPESLPYSELEELSIAHWRIVDAGGNTVAEGASGAAAIADGKATVGLPLDNIAEGNYKLLVSEISGARKADQPLILSGSWECEFSK